VVAVANRVIDVTRPVVFANVSALRFGNLLLRANGLLLAVFGVIASIADLAGHFLGIGPHGTRLLGDPGTLGYFEAHALAVIVGVVLFRCAPREDNAGHVLGAGVHAVLGGSNLLFWAAAEHYGMQTTVGAATVVHGVLVVAHLAAAAAKRPDLLTGLAGSFRVAALVTLWTGLVLHASSLPLGREAFVERMFTPTFDLLLSIPMTFAGVVGWLLWRRTRTVSPVHGFVHGFMLVYFSISIPIHLRTLFTWRTDYVLGFPSWYSLVILPLLIGLTVSVLKLEFDGPRREPSPA
jgi:hypothetical protein